jgi:hypothetical protein
MNCTPSELKEPHYIPPMRERLRVWWHNWRNRKTAKAVHTLCKALQNDPAFARTWHSNIAMPIHDSSVLNMESCNKLADKLMKHLFNVERTWEI